MENPLLLKPKTLYICGPDMDSNRLSNAVAFEEIAMTIQENGFSFYSPFGRPLTYRVAFLSQCNGVVCLPGWEEDPFCKTEVTIARTLHLETIFSHAFTRWANSQLNQQTTK